MVQKIQLARVRALSVYNPYPNAIFLNGGFLVKCCCSTSVIVKNTTEGEVNV